MPITVPSTDAVVPHSAITSLNVLERWAAHGPCPEEKERGGDDGAFCNNWRTVPAANPRYLYLVVVHKNEEGARTASFGENLQGINVLNATGLFVSHVMGLTRSTANKPETAYRDAVLAGY